MFHNKQEKHNTNKLTAANIVIDSYFPVLLLHNMKHTGS